MTDTVKQGGNTTFASPDDQLTYIQRVAEEGTSMITKKNGTVVQARAGVNFIEGSGITLTTADDPTNNHVSVTITNAASAITAPVTVANGGTGRTTLTANSLLVGNGTTAVTQLAVGATGKVLGVSAGAPAWVDIDGGSA